MLKFFITVLLFLFTSMSYADRIEYVTGYGNEFSYCNTNSGYFCFDNVKRRAESSAEQDARWNCELNRRGRALTYTSSFSTFCTPNYLPPVHDGTNVSCRSDCRLQCEIPEGRN